MKKLLMLALCMLFLLLQYRLWEGDGSIQDVMRLSKTIGAQKEEIEKLTQRNRQLDLEIQVLKMHPEALEERARSELGMIKKGETFCLIVEPTR